MIPRGWLIAATVMLAAGVAHADRAEQLFKKGKRLLAEKRYAEACTAFQDSDRLDPGIGAKLNVARCYQEWGKLATAWRWYRDAEQVAHDANDDRAKKIHALITDLDPTIPRLIVKVPAGASTATAEITLDGTPLDASALGAEQRVDPGPHQVAYLVDGRREEKVLPIERGGNAEVTLELSVKHRKADRVAHVSHASSQEGASDATPGQARRWIGLGVAGGGVVALGVAGVVTYRARADYHHALSAHCRGANDMCDAIGQAAADSAHHRANLATIVTVAGAAAIAGGLVLYFTAPSTGSRDEHALYLAPAVGGDRASFVLGGAF